VAGQALGDTANEPMSAGFGKRSSDRSEDTQVELQEFYAGLGREESSVRHR
jgi:hypothetical protein